MNFDNGKSLLDNCLDVAIENVLNYCKIISKATGISTYKILLKIRRRIENEIHEKEQTSNGY